MVLEVQSKCTGISHRIRGFRPKEVSKHVGISYRQIQYWDKTNFIRPSRRVNGQRIYTIFDMMMMKFAKILRNHGYSIQGLRKMVNSIKTVITNKYLIPHNVIVFVKDDQFILTSDSNCYVPENWIRIDFKEMVQSM